MSLKAKLEAVIYAAEEPVTMAQLAGLFTEEALEWKAERDAAAAETAERAALPLLNDAFGYLELEAGAEAKDPGAAGGGAEIASAGGGGAIEPSTEKDAGSAGLETRTAAGLESGATASEMVDATPETGAAEAASEPNAADETATAKQLAKQREREARTAIKLLLVELIEEYASEGRGIEIREIAGGYRMGTKAQFHDAVRSFVKSLKPALKLSLPALETLAVIAYKQPVTAPEVNEIRGVDSSGVFGSLLARKLIVTAGRKPVVGRPILYKTTREFLLRFGLKDVSELPSMEEFEKMAASELEADEATEEAMQNGAGEEFTADPSVELEEDEAVAPEATGGSDAAGNPSDSTEGDAAQPGNAE
jgi:segregation and condensation protein B